MNKNLLAIGILAIGIVFAVAIITILVNPKWILIKRDAEKKVTYYIKDKFTIFPTTRKPSSFWVKAVYDVAKPGDAKTMFMHHPVKCDEMSVKIGNTSIYNDRGQLIGDGIVHNSAWIKVVPGSVMESIVQKVCN
jgi:hypothetical protein